MHAYSVCTPFDTLHHIASTSVGLDMSDKMWAWKVVTNLDTKKLCKNAGSLRLVGVSTVWPTSLLVWRCMMGTATGRSTFVVACLSRSWQTSTQGAQCLQASYSSWSGGSKLPHHGQLQETSSRSFASFSVVLPPFSKPNLHVWNNCPFSMSQCTTQTLPRMCLSFWHFSSSLYAVSLVEACTFGST